MHLREPLNSSAVPVKLRSLPASEKANEGFASFSAGDGYPIARIVDIYWWELRGQRPRLQLALVKLYVRFEGKVDFTGLAFETMLVAKEDVRPCMIENALNIVAQGFSTERTRCADTQLVECLLSAHEAR